MTKTKFRKLTPTLWRTCRTLANRSRLKLFRHLLPNPGVTVSDLAAGLKLNPALTSKYLRELNARGLLLVTRHGTNVLYRVGADQSAPQATALVTALTGVFNDKNMSIEMLYRKITAFTHPRRVAIAGRLQQGPASFSDLRRQLGISTPALQRHLRKLASRNFIQPHTDRGVYTLITSGSPLEMALVNLTQEG